MPERIIILSATGLKLKGEAETIPMYGTRIFRVARLEPQKNFVIFKRNLIIFTDSPFPFISSPNKDT